jgi:uncharacterized protein YegP (UPF0339 family)
MDDLWYPIRVQKKEEIMDRPTVEFYRDSEGDYRWRMIAKNGRKVADSAEGYEALSGAVKGLRIVTGIALRLTQDFLSGGEGDFPGDSDTCNVAWPCRTHLSEADCEEHGREDCHS